MIRKSLLGLCFATALSFGAITTAQAVEKTGYSPACNSTQIQVQTQNAEISVSDVGKQVVSNDMKDQNDSVISESGSNTAPDTQYLSGVASQKPFDPIWTIVSGSNESINLPIPQTEYGGLD